MKTAARYALPCLLAVSTACDLDHELDELGVVDEEDDRTLSPGLTPEQQHLNESIPGVEDWTHVRRGVFEGVDTNGVLVRVYARDARDTYLQELKATLDRLDRSAAEDPETAVLLERERAALGDELRGHVTQAGTADLDLDWPSEPVASGSVGSVCRRSAYLTSTFTHAWGASIASATGTSPKLGSGPQFSPPAPAPLSIYRYTHAKVGTKIAYAHQASGAADQNTLSASVSQIVFPGSCGMETHHSISATCYDGSTGFLAITTKQTCAGVLNGTPPVQE